MVESAHFTLFELDQVRVLPTKMTSASGDGDYYVVYKKNCQINEKRHFSAIFDQNTCCLSKYFTVKSPLADLLRRLPLI
jgi:hypothetical protein